MVFFILNYISHILGVKHGVKMYLLYGGNNQKMKKPKWVVIHETDSKKIKIRSTDCLFSRLFMGKLIYFSKIKHNEKNEI